MGREINRLSARKVQTLSEPGRHDDGGGLYLVVEAAPLQVLSVTASAATHLANRAVIRHTAVSNTNYIVLASDVHVGFTSLTASRAVTLCDVDTYPLGQDLVIDDEAGACSDSLRITVQIGSGTGDSIPQQSDGIIVLVTRPFAFVVGPLISG